MGKTNPQYSFSLFSEYLKLYTYQWKRGSSDTSMHLHMLNIDWIGKCLMTDGKSKLFLLGCISIYIRNVKSQCFRAEKNVGGCLVQWFFFSEYLATKSFCLNVWWIPVYHILLLRGKKVEYLSTPEVSKGASQSQF